ncbi:carboxylesterase family protein, partial [Actinoplanes sp. NPDC051851]|uniref:carboxylesterase family protein n=1 Tax=Actinoplanes sp. NPDC051851 TaxID=3154753 RepID=UPI00343696CA
MPQQPEVRTSTGLVRGRAEDGLAVFRGIPYAAAPIGDARFQSPRPATAWDGARPAESLGPPPPPDATKSRPPPGDQVHRTPDDMRTLNHRTPAPHPPPPHPPMG